VKRQTGLEIADRVESTIRDKIVLIAAAPGIGHWRKDLTDEPVKFFPVYSCLIVYLPEKRPLQVVAIVHGNRDVERLLKNRLRNSEKPRRSPPMLWTPAARTG
jgi:plasmid stabilization system protein ParE